MRNRRPIDSALRDALFQLRPTQLSKSAQINPIEASLTVMIVEALDTPERARQLLDFLLEDPTISPQKYDLYEPIRRLVNVETMDDMVSCVARGLIFKRSKPSLSGSVFPSRPTEEDQHAWISMDASTIAVVARPWQELARRVAGGFTVDYAYIHQLTVEEIPFSVLGGVTYIQGIDSLDCVLTVSPRNLQRFLPDIYWANLFGPPYVEHFGRSRLLATPADTVEEWPNGCIYVRLSEDPLDFENNYARMQAIRDRIKEHLGMESFFDLGRGLNGRYSVPNFRLWQRRGLEAPPKPRHSNVPVPNPANELRKQMIIGLTRWRDYAFQREPLLPTLQIEPDTTIKALPCGSNEETLELARQLIAANPNASSYILVYDGEVTVEGDYSPAFIAEGALRGSGEALLYVQRYRWCGLLHKSRELVGTPMRTGSCTSLFSK